jgi:hypothetical protein
VREIGKMTASDVGREEGRKRREKPVSAVTLVDAMQRSHSCLLRAKNIRSGKAVSTVSTPSTPGRDVLTSPARCAAPHGSDAMACPACSKGRQQEAQLFSTGMHPASIRMAPTEQRLDARQGHAASAIDGADSRQRLVARKSPGNINERPNRPGTLERRRLRRQPTIEPACV